MDGGEKDGLNKGIKGGVENPKNHSSVTKRGDEGGREEGGRLNIDL